MFRLEEFAGKRILTSSLLQDEGLMAFFTTRDLPLKTGERDYLTDQIELNKKLVCQKLGISTENLIIPQQTHSDNVGVIDAKTQRRKEAKQNENFTSLHPSIFASFVNTDALVTDTQNIALALNFADCVPILFYDPVKKIIAAAHAGWRGTAAQIAPKTVQKMVKEFSCKPSDIIAAIGPAIGNCCFEAQKDVLEQLAATIKDDSSAISNNHADLKLINKLQLLACGLEKIDVCEYCTSCQNELFFSYRREQGNTARHSIIIMLRGKQ